LVVALSTMGVSTVAIGALPTYRTIASPRRCFWRYAALARSLGLGGEWGGAVLLAD